MNREIKFRIWDGKKFHYPECELEKTNHYLQFGSNGVFFLHNVDGDYITGSKDGGIVEQFTGLKDTKGVEIFEGDLVSFGDVHWGDDGMPDIKEIVFDEDSASFRIYDYLELQGSSLAEKWFIDDMIDCLSVIGNIHSNPELLEYLK